MILFPGSTKLMFAKSSQLPALVETDKHHLEEAKQSLKEEQRKKDKQFAAYYQVWSSTPDIY